MIFLRLIIIIIIKIISNSYFIPTQLINKSPQKGEIILKNNFNKIINNPINLITDCKHKKHRLSSLNEPSTTLKETNNIIEYISNPKSSNNAILYTNNQRCPTTLKDISHFTHITIPMSTNTPINNIKPVNDKCVRSELNVINRVYVGGINSSKKLDTMYT